MGSEHVALQPCVFARIFERLLDERKTHTFGPRANFEVARASVYASFAPLDSRLDIFRILWTSFEVHYPIKGFHLAVDDVFLAVLLYVHMLFSQG